jgi:hypothetical protein
MIILLFTAKSIYDFNSPNINWRFSAQISEETHIILHKARMLDLSKALELPSLSFLYL